jgi:hypothetical protein
MSLKRRGLLFISILVFGVGCGTTKPEKGRLPPVEIVTPTPKRREREKATTGHSRDAYMQRTQEIRRAHKAAPKKRTATNHAQGLGRKVYQGKYEDLPEELAHRADLILIPVPDSEEVLIYEPAGIEDEP